MHVFLCIAAAAVAREQQGELGRLTDLRGREWLGSSFRTPLAYYSRLTSTGYTFRVLDLLVYMEIILAC